MQNTIYQYQCPCNLTIGNFSTSSSEVISGGSMTFSGAISESYGNPVNWTLSVGGKSITGTDAQISTQWDGKGSDGLGLSPGSYAATLTASVNGGCAESKTVNFTVKPSCDLKVDVHSSSATPYYGEAIPIKADIADSSGNPVEWSIVLPSGERSSGAGTDLSANWDGKIGEKIVPGAYTATITAKSGESCSESVGIPITITPSPENNSCGLQVHVGSSANMANGNLSHSQQLFTTKSGKLPLEVTLYYNSLDPHNGALGHSWSHNYDISLKKWNDGSVLISEGNWKYQYFTPSGDSYAAQAGNYSTLAKNADGTFTMTEKDGTRYNFSAAGLISSMADRNGNTLSFSYSGGNLATVTDPAGRSTTFAYDAAGPLATLTDPSGSRYTLTYSGSTLSSVTYPDGGSWHYSYDANAFMLSKTDPAGNTTSYAYDAEHRVVSATDPEGKVRSVAYPTGTATTKSTTFTEKDGGQWQYSYDTQAGTLAAKSDPQGGVTSYMYDASGNRTATTLPDGSTTRSSYDAKGNVASTTDALNQTTTYSYNNFGQVTSIRDAQGEITGYGYDASGNLTSTTDPAGATTQYQYDSRGKVTKVTNAAGQATSFTYDAGGNLASVTDPTGATTSYGYDASGNLTAQTDASGATTGFAYNAKNQVVKVTDPQGNVTVYSYDANGNKASQTDANGNSTTYRYNFKGDLVSARDTLGNVTTYAYGSTGCPSCGGGTDKLTSISDANGNSTSYQYDNLGRLLSETDPLGNVTNYAYDPSGNLVAKTDGNGATTRYAYDSLGRLLKKTYPDATTTTFSYDAKGRVMTAGNQNISYALSYDANGNVTSATDSNGRSIGYSYDALGQKTKTVSPDGRTLTYSYDKAGRLTGLLDDGNFSIGYDNLGRRSSLAYPNGDKTTYGYDSAGRLLNLIRKNKAGSVIASNSYTHDQTANRLSNTSQDKSVSYQYDSIYRLTQALSSTPGNSSNTNGRGGGIPNATQQQKEFYSYDAVGNRLASDRIAAYVYNPANQLVVNGGSHHYDKNGNLIQKVASEGTTNYEWDYENRLVKVTAPDGTVAEFAYDPFGKRIAKQVIENGTSTNTRYFYDNQNIFFEYDDGGAIGNRYTHGPGIDEPLMVTTAKEKYYYHADGLGSIIALSDRAGKMVQSYEYDSFGNLKDQMSRVKQPYTYTGREWDKETGLYYYRARYYDPMEGRFIQKDPIGFEGGINLYAYVDNNPVNWVDPFGESALPPMPKPPPTIPTIPPPPRPPIKPPKPPGTGCSAMFRVCMAFCTSRCPGGLIGKGACAAACTAAWVACVTTGN